MSKTRGNKPISFSLWSSSPRFAASRLSEYFNLTFNDPIPLKHWRPNFRFIGLSDGDLFRLSRGTFPRRLELKTRPLHSLGGMPHDIAYKVCPCSSRRPFDMRKVRYVREGCRLLHTNYVVDRKSYLIENVVLNVPSSLCRELRFLGEVPDECIETETKQPAPRTNS
jgi:hypothetical protein